MSEPKKRRRHTPFEQFLMLDVMRDPTTQLSKQVTIFFALNGVAILVMLFDAIRQVRRKERADRRAE